MGNKLFHIAAIVLLLPVIAIIAPLLIVISATAGTGAPAAAATIACVYSYVDPVRVAAVMADLTEHPVSPEHWEQYAAAAGHDGEDYDPADTDAINDILLTGVQTIAGETYPAAVMTAPLVWWHGAMPVDDNDDTWTTTPVPGWDGTLDSYIAALMDAYVDPKYNTDDEEGCIPPYAPGCGMPAELSAILATIRHLESGDNYTESHRSRAKVGNNGSGNPTGAYQFVYNTWGQYDGFDEAYLAPPEVQDARASDDVNVILEHFNGDPAWVPIAWYLGLGGAQKIEAGEWSMSYLPNPEHNTLTVGQYQGKWMDHYSNVALPATVGESTAECQLGETVIEWAETQIGAPYAAINPFRFGTPTWPAGPDGAGASLAGFRDDPYQFPVGTVVYDCSGFVIAAWRAAGIDLMNLYGVTSSQQFPTIDLPEIPPEQVQPGDIATYTPVNGVGHIVLVHHVANDGTVHTIEAAASTGVAVRAINWDRVSSIKRPSMASES